MRRASTSSQQRTGSSLSPSPLSAGQEGRGSIPLAGSQNQPKKISICRFIFLVSRKARGEGEVAKKIGENRRAVGMLKRGGLPLTAYWTGARCDRGRFFFAPNHWTVDPVFCFPISIRRTASSVCFWSKRIQVWLITISQCLKPLDSRFPFMYVDGFPTNHWPSMSSIIVRRFRGKKAVFPRFFSFWASCFQGAPRHVCTKFAQLFEGLTA